MSSGRVKRYRGVRQRQWGSWVSEIRHSISKTRVWLGTFDTAKQAAKAYDEAARLMEGPTRAKTNFSSSSSSSSSLLSPAVRAKLQRCNCLATLQGPSKLLRLTSSSSSTPPSTCSSSSSTSSALPHPLLPKFSRPPPSSFAKLAPPPQSHPPAASSRPRQSLVCLRLDDSHDQLGVTWQSSSASTPLWFTTLPVHATSPSPSASHVSSLPPQLPVESATFTNQVSYVNNSVPDLALHMYANSTYASREGSNSQNTWHVSRSCGPAQQISQGATHVSNVHADSIFLCGLNHSVEMGGVAAGLNLEAPAARNECDDNGMLPMQMPLQYMQYEAAAACTYSNNTNNMIDGADSSSAETPASSPDPYDTTSCTPYIPYGTTSCTAPYPGMNGSSSVDALASLTAALWYLEQEENLTPGSSTSYEGRPEILEASRSVPIDLCEQLNQVSYLPLQYSTELDEQQLWQ